MPTILPAPGKPGNARPEGRTVGHTGPGSGHRYGRRTGTLTAPLDEREVHDELSTAGRRLAAGSAGRMAAAPTGRMAGPGRWVPRAVQRPAGVRGPGQRPADVLPR